MIDKKNHFNSKIAEYTTKNDNEILEFLSDFWSVKPNTEGIIKLYASY